MTEKSLLGQLRLLVGDPPLNEISDRKLISFVTFAMEWFACEMEHNVIDDTTSLVLTAGQGEYPLPATFLVAIWFEHNDIRLEPMSLSAKDRDQEAWQQATSGTPVSYAIQGRKVSFHPPPDSSAVSTDSIVSYRYVASATALGPQGPQGLSEADQWLLIYRAARDFCVANPSDMNMARIAGYDGTVAEMLLRSKQRWLNPTRHQHPQFKPWTGGRSGGAR